MPIANCIVTAECIGSSNQEWNLIDLWAEAASLSSEHMTINLLSNTQQLGNQYHVIANLQLPSIWSPPDISSLQTGLARALSSYFSVPLSTIHVITNVIESGLIIEDGREVKW